MEIPIAGKTNWMIKIITVLKTTRLMSIRKVVEDVRAMNEEICIHFMREYDRNIVEGGIWGDYARGDNNGTRFPPNKPSTTIKRLYEGKNPQAMFGLRGKLKYSVGRTQFSLFTTDPDVVRMHRGPGKKEWKIEAKEHPFLSFPIAERGGKGRVRSGSPYLWFVGKSVKHKGWKRRILLPPVIEVGIYSRMIVAQKIREAG
jgi:hypothetical protein